MNSTEPFVPVVVPPLPLPGAVPVPVPGVDPPVVGVGAAAMNVMVSAEVVVVDVSLAPDVAPAAAVFAGPEKGTIPG